MTSYASLLTVNEPDGTSTAVQVRDRSARQHRDDDDEQLSQDAPLHESLQQVGGGVRCQGGQRRVSQTPTRRIIVRRQMQRKHDFVYGLGKCF